MEQELEAERAMSQGEWNTPTLPGVKRPREATVQPGAETPREANKKEDRVPAGRALLVSWAPPVRPAHATRAQTKTKDAQMLCAAVQAEAAAVAWAPEDWLQPVGGGSRQRGSDNTYVRR